MPLVEDADITLLYAPRTRAFTALWLLEELGRPYRLELVDMAAGAHKRPDFLKKNPMGKVPAVLDGGTPVAETGAIAAYLADKYALGRLAPKIGDPARAVYLRWLFFAPGVMEPALGEKFFQWDVPASSVGWGSFAQMVAALAQGVRDGPFLLGETFTAADVVVASTARFGILFGALATEGPIAAYVERATAREAHRRALDIETDYAARMAR